MTADSGPSAFRRVPLTFTLQRTRIIAVLLGGDPDRAEAVAETLVANGIRCLELAMTAPGALGTLERLAARFPDDVDLGIGAVMTPQDVVRAAGAGARFIASPNAAPDVIHAARNLEVASHPGAMTPGEIHLAWRAGASAVRLFPAGSLGTGHLEAVRAALPDIPLIPSGSITLSGTADWFAAGAAAVVFGPELLGDALTPGGDLDRLAGRALQVRAGAEHGHQQGA
jgi:2-dehydro-3-deoxyphosphogluconate aldolase/(4S)-4-hydroxy-2-oxoglutarate aldolase